MIKKRPKREPHGTKPLLCSSGPTSEPSSDSNKTRYHPWHHQEQNVSKSMPIAWACQRFCILTGLSRILVDFGDSDSRRFYRMRDH
ncbi:hypothetical protein JTE90_013678 [Oedothorax gibbosus]|uniref:Uncharacterized protein n=1 Tax=Oedothorax gibbosus TaxID=931172 RepID=A0AAV6VBL5_9ARAC|nr:hypothetical protein JTE90_013678 [Oedothorax gibbosus]